MIMFQQLYASLTKKTDNLGCDEAKKLTQYLCQQRKTIVS